ncbi:bifunctional lysylphosphatidylglycerol flippase/synthetase MprF [Azohydromonas australica]|uniref:bifunctional lysylphosphatidylglycerol flippase/synthetase MprF n=1 Tax=Azohydromonas australica TaxID=364039 RepID=UPI000688BDC2|nr:bifunctional lysylphosphatidylglycerol flippase/synthetase MprF [Azohydromonas australica]
MLPPRPLDQRLALARRLLRRAGPFAGIAVFALALWVLQDWLRGQRYHELLDAVSALPASALVQAGLLTLAGYATLTGYDLLAMRFIGRRVPGASVASTAFIANALGNNFGNTLVTGAAVRYWTYTAAGLSAAEVSKVVLFCSAGFWLGFLGVGGVAFVLGPVPLPQALRWAGATTRALGWAFLALLGAYLLLSVASAAGRLSMPGPRPWRLPSPALTLGQLGVASLDLCLMSAVFHALLPPSAGVSYLQGVAVFLIALLAGNASLVPGGLGVFESAMVLMLGQRVGAAELAAALLLFRGVYFIAPLFAAALLVGLRAGRGLPPAWRSRLASGTRILMALVPQILAALVFMAGALLLFSGSLPASAGRLEVLSHVLALPLIESSHFLASLAGSALLLLAHALQRRLDAAWHLALVLLLGASLLSLAKGWDYEEAFLMGCAAVALLPARRQFHRRSSLLGEPLRAPWIAAIVMVLGASGWLVLLTNRHALHADLSWWSFTLHAEAARSLRATVGAVALAALFGLYRLLRPVRPAIAVACAEDIEHARRIVERSPCTYANLVLRGDKAVLFSQARDAFLMYGRSGRSWIAMGDPVGDAAGGRELLWRFHDLCDRYDGWCVFFEVRGQRRAEYAEQGLVLTPLGEQARVDLTRFDLALPAHAGLRQARNRLLRCGYRFEIVPCEAVPPLVPALRELSDAWLRAKATHEKGFSNASFDARYLEQFPLALVRGEEGIVAFANLWCGAGRQELSVDLMRRLPTAPRGSMDFLFSELMLWGRTQGYRWFDFGMAPLSGLDARRDAPIWGRIGTLLYRHGEHFYNFEGLRHYKAKFNPVWEPLYLASPGGVALPAILVDVTALMAGSLAGIFTRFGPGQVPSPGPSSIAPRPWTSQKGTP